MCTQARLIQQMKKQLTEACRGNAAGLAQVNNLSENIHAQDNICIYVSI